MKATLAVLVGLGILTAFPGITLASTQAQAVVSGVLDDLQFVFVEPKDGRVGGPQEYVATRETLDYLRGKSFWLMTDGSITYKKPGGGGPRATPDQALASSALSKLKFQYVRPRDGRVGGDQEYQMTTQTLNFLRQYNRFWLLNDGSITFTRPRF